MHRLESMKINDADKIRRKEYVPEEDRTSMREETADFIESEVVEHGRWPMKFTEIEQLSKEKSNGEGWSRQHITNTLRAYFEPANGTKVGELAETSDGKRVQLDIVIPDGVEREEDYLRGYVDGWLKRR